MDSSREDLLRLLTLTAHELRTPLSVTGGYLKMLTSERLGPLNEAQQKAVTAAARSCDQLLALASDLSALARLERGETPLKRVPVLVSALVRDAISSYPTSPSHPVTITETGEEDATVTVDPVRARNALQSLIAAVARTAPDEATLRVSRVLHTDNGRTFLYIIIAPGSQADRETVVDHRHTAAFEPWDGGLGVGLPLALRFLRLEGGDVRGLDTDSPGLVISLPVTTAARSATQAGA
jgi:signal transduction histidine kinase